MSDEAVLDTTLPILDSISIKDPIVDRGEGDNSVTVLLAASDADSEVASIKVTVTDPDGGTMVKTLSAPSGELTFTIADDRPEGEYKVTEVVVTDAAGNARTYDGPNLSSLFNVAVTVKNAEEDTTPPELVDFHIIDPVVDLTAGDRKLTIDIELSDDISGLKSATAWLISLETGQMTGVNIHMYDSANGQMTLTLPENHLAGDYGIQLRLVDNTGNYVFLSPDQLNSLGFNSSVTVINDEGDSKPPELLSLDVVDPNVKVDEGDNQVTVRIAVSDNPSGVQNAVLYLVAPNGTVLRAYLKADGSTEEFTFTIPDYFPSGTYKFQLFASDKSGNHTTYYSDDIAALGFDATVKVSGTTPDTEAPELKDFRIDDPIINIDEGDRSITVHANLIDDHSGIDYFSIALWGPSNQKVSQRFYEGDVTHTFTLPEHAASGEYQIAIIGVDKAGNHFNYSYSDIIEMGFSASFEVSDASGGGNDDDTLPGGNDDDTLPGGNEDDADDGDDGDHDKGHGNDEDGLDEDNPGNSGGSNGDDTDHDDNDNDGDGDGDGDGDRDHDDNGHGNDEDGVDESNPGNSSGTNRRHKGSDDDDTIEGSEGDDTITGGDGDDNLEAGDGDDHIWAGATDTGNDRLAGGRGNDVIGGGKGNDLIVGGNRRKGEDDTDDDGSDILYGGDGDDTLIGGAWDDSSGDGTFSLGEEASDELAANSLWGGDGDDLIIGADGADTVGGGDGSDQVNAGGGNDKVYGGRGSEGGSDDVIDGGDGDDMIFASDGNDFVLGGDGDDDLYSGTGNDTVDGGDGNDTLWGGGGDDLFTGGSGADVFAFGASSGNDTVTDFSVTEDELRLTATVTDFTDAESVAAAATETAIGGKVGLLIDTGDGNSVFLIGLTLEDIGSMTMLLD